ncbi:MAG: HisA/HisF-related TIM barrel protein [Candidatus Micrarchaeota archaeon]
MAKDKEEIHEKALKIPVMYVKDKQAFTMRREVLKLIGKPIDLAKKMKEDGVKLIHIIDLDAEKGNTTNFDMYNKITYFLNIEIETNNEKAIHQLLGIRCRIVVKLPSKLDLGKLEKRLLVGRVDSKDIDTRKVYDVIVNKEELIGRFKNRTIFDGKLDEKSEKNIQNKLFGILVRD